MLQTRVEEQKKNRPHPPARSYFCCIYRRTRGSAAGTWERMARVALPRSIVFLLLTVVSGMPAQDRARGLTRNTPRLQCPTCFKSFGSETALRQHRAKLLARDGGTGAFTCAADQRIPLVTGRNGQGQRAAAGMAGHGSDSDSQGGRDGGDRPQSPLQGGSPSPPPVDRDAVPPADGPADGGGAQADLYLYKHICTYTGVYMHIQTNTGVYVHIHTHTYQYQYNTYKYIHI